MICESTKNVEGGRLMVALLLFVGALQVAGYYLAGALVNGDGPMAIPQPDTLLYMQAARRIAEGHAFSFSAGTAASTGTTSVLYPFVLAVPYLLGAKGDALVCAGFLLNAVFYLVFLWGWAKVVSAVFQKTSLRLAALSLLALSPQPAYCALSQSDIGLWLAVSGLFAAAFMSGRCVPGAALLALGPWIRPEGMVLVLAFSVYALVVRRRAEILTAIAGIVSSAGVFALNFFLTGRAQFSSVANKGYFTTHTLPEAIYMTASDMVQVLKGFVLGLSDYPPRVFFLIPVVGAAFFVWGLLTHKWSGEKGVKLGTLFVAVLGCFATVAMSGWQNTNVDRYIAWTFPLVVVFVAQGASDISSRLESAWARRVVVWLPAAYAALSSFVMFAVYNGNSRDSELVREFARRCETLMEDGASVGAMGRTGMAYDFSDRRFAHLAGIYSLEFRSRELLSTLEILKNEPDTRFDYWILSPDGGFGDDFRHLAGEQVSVGPIGLELLKANWRPFDNAALPPVVEGAELVCKIDVGYEKDEELRGYRVEQTYGQRPFAPMLKIAEGRDGSKMAEVARMVAGFDEMTVPLAVGRDSTVVMRTYDSCSIAARGAFVGSRVKYEIANPARMNVAVDGQIAGEVSFSMATNGFSDVSFTIPGRFITSPASRVAFLGDHIACCYWFYQ